MSHPAAAAINSHENRGHANALHRVAEHVPALCKHDKLEPLYRIARPYPQAAIKRVLGATLVATVCLSCHMLRWTDIDELEG